MATVTLIYAYWPNQPQGISWCDLPWALRDAGLPAELTAAGHEVIETMLMSESAFPDELPSGFELAAEIADQVREAQAKGEFPVVLCGSCAVAAIGTVAGLGANTGVAWFDAHPDLMTPETTTSGLFEGMALACAGGAAWRSMCIEHAGLTPVRWADVVLVGARDIEQPEADIIAQNAIPVIGRGESDVIVDRLNASARTYVHLDMDVHDPSSVPARHFPVAGGLKAGDVRALLQAVPRLAALSVTGLDPSASDGKTAEQVAIAHIIAAAEVFATGRDAVAASASEPPRAPNP
jgi:arginase